MVDLVGSKRACKVKIRAGRGRVSGQRGGKNLPRFAHRWPARVNCTEVTVGATTGDHQKARGRGGYSVARGLEPPLFRKKPTLILEPDQRVRLRARRGPWRGSFRAVSEPYTDESGEVVIQVSKEKDYQNSIKQGRRPAGIPWPARQIEPVPLSQDTGEDTQDLSGRLGGPWVTREFRRPWWRRLLGG